MALSQSAILGWRATGVTGASSKSGGRTLAKGVVGHGGAQQHRYNRPQTRLSPQPSPTSIEEHGDRIKGGRRESLWQSWLNLTLGTKMAVAFGIGVIGVVGLLASDYLERRMPAANEGAHVEGRRKPRLLGISVVDRDEKQQMV